MRQSVLPCPKERIPTPVTGSLVQNDSAALPRCRDVGDAVPYGRFAVILRRAGPMCPAAIRAVPAAGRCGHRPLRNRTGFVQRGTSVTPSPTK